MSVLIVIELQMKSKLSKSKHENIKVYLSNLQIDEYFCKCNIVICKYKRFAIFVIQKH